MIGGGTGSFTLLSELKNTPFHLTAVVNMSDDGGSTGRLRDELGVLPPGDLRQCLIALSTIPEARDLFNVRFDTEGPLDEHSLGNLILSGLEHHYGSIEQAIAVASKLLATAGDVIPVTTTSHTLVLQDAENTTHGEFAIGHLAMSPGTRTISHLPTAHLNPRAKKAIAQADLVVIAPGNLYGSLLPALSVKGMRQALAGTKGKLVLIANLVTKPGQTDGWHVMDYVEEIERYTGEGSINTVLYNTRKPERALLERYAAEGERPVATKHHRFQADRFNRHIIGVHLVATRIWKRGPGDKSMPRTLIRHDAQKVVRHLQDLLIKAA